MIIELELNDLDVYKKKVIECEILKSLIKLHIKGKISRNKFKEKYENITRIRANRR